MNSGESDDKDLSEETQYIMNQDDFEESIELKLDTQTSDLAESIQDLSPPSDEGLFTAPPSRTSLHASNISADDKLFVTASQNTITLSDSDDTFSKLGHLSDSNNSPDFRHSSDPTILTPLSDDVKPSSQDLFHSTSSGNRLISSQRVYEPFTSSTPRVVRDSSSSDIDSPASKKPKLDPDGDSSVEVITKISPNSNPAVLKSDTSMEVQCSVEQVSGEGKTEGPSPDKQGSQNSAVSTIILDSSNTWTPAPPTTTENFTLHLTQTCSQVKELTDVDAPKHSSNGITNSTNGSLKTNFSWGSHNFEEDYNSHPHLHNKSLSKTSKPKSEQHPKIADDTLVLPATVVLKKVYSDSNKLTWDILEISVQDYATKEYRLSFSSVSSGALGDVSSGSSSLYSGPPPASLRPRGIPIPSDSTSSENSGDRIIRERSKLRLVNGNKVNHYAKQSPSQFFERLQPVRCCNCQYAFPTTAQLLSPSSLNGTTNGKAKLISVNSSGRDLDTPDISSQTDTNSRSPASPITYQEITRSLNNPLGNQTIAFGFWPPNIYYPCRILNNSGDKYSVFFLDGVESELTKNKLIPLSIVVPSSNIKVQVNMNSSSYVNGQLEAISDSNDSAPFVVKVGNETKNFPIVSIAISEGQRKALLKNDTRPPAANLSSIDLDNCTNSKRNRTPRQSSIITTNVSSPRTGKSASARKLFKNTEPKPTTSDGKSPRGNKKSAACKSIEEPKSDSDFEWKQYKLDLSGNGIRGVHLEKKDSEDPLSNLKQKNITSLNDDKALMKEYGPIPIKGSNLFAGFVFVLSYTDEEIGKSVLPMSSVTLESSMSSEADTDGDEFRHSSYPFSKSRLMTQIKAGGGVYYENITDVPFNELKNTILITNKPSLTCTYIYALAAGIRAYSHCDLIHCCVTGTSFSEYIKSKTYLPSGWSYSVGYKLIPRKNTQIFKKTWILLLLDEKAKGECINFWTAILEIAGAQLKRGYAKVGTDESPVIAITDESCQQEILDKKDVTCVSVVWLIQCLINNRKLKPDKHPHFKYNFRPSRKDDSS